MTLNLDVGDETHVGCSRRGTARTLTPGGNDLISQDSDFLEGDGRLFSRDFGMPYLWRIGDIPRGGPKVEALPDRTTGFFRLPAAPIRRWAFDPRRIPGHIHLSRWRDPHQFGTFRSTT